MIFSLSSPYFKLYFPPLNKVTSITHQLHLVKCLYILSWVESGYIWYIQLFYGRNYVLKFFFTLFSQIQTYLFRLLIAKFRLKLKKVGKTTRSFRYDLSQIPYNYTVEVTNRFKGLDLIDRVPEELWMEVHDIVQEAVIKTIPKKKKCKKAKWLSEEAL